MEVKLVKKEKDFIEVKIAGEGHTLCNAIRNELWDHKETSFASYNLTHPLVSMPVLVLKVKSGDPKQVLLNSTASLKTKNQELRNTLSKA